MAKPLEKTPRKDVYVSYSEQIKKGKKVFYAQLKDEHGDVIEGCNASYTQQSYDNDEDARIAARNKAMKKFDKKFSIAMAEEVGVGENFFTERWLEIDADKRIDLASASHDNQNSRQKAISYFEKNTLPLLDHFGPFISADECRTVSETLYSKMLNNKRYTFCYADKGSVQAVQHFIATAKEFLAQNKSVKSVLGSFPQGKYVKSLMEMVEARIMEEDRLRSLLEFTLKNETKMDDFISNRLWVKIEENGPLITELKKIKFEENRLIAAEKIVFMLREISGDENQTKLQTNVHIRDANEILSNLCIASQKPMPAISLPEFVVDHVPQIETCKELLWKVRVRFSAICMHIAADDPDAVGGIMMETAGPRVAEVCAIQFGDILDSGDWGVCVINYTVDGDIRKENGKNIYFHRPVFFPKFAMDAIHKRKNKILEMGYTEEELKQAYVVNRPGDVFAPANLHAFSAKIKRFLQLAGCVDDYWDSVHYAMTVQPDLDFFRRPELFDIAYGLRRDATTMMCNVAKMNPVKVDAILGHRLPAHVENWNDKITREDEWRVIIAELERVVYDPEHSNHPLFAVQDAEKMMATNTALSDAIAYHGTSITSDTSIQLEAQVQTVGNSDICFTLPANAEYKASVVGVANTAGPHQWLGRLHTKEEYERVKAQAIEDYMLEVKKNESAKKKSQEKTI